MNDQEPSRVLLVEPLESRSMLAGGFFAEWGFADHDVHDHANVKDRGDRQAAEYSSFNGRGSSRDRSLEFYSFGRGSVELSQSNSQLPDRPIVQLVFVSTLNPSSVPSNGSATPEPSDTRETLSVDPPQENRELSGSTQRLMGNVSPAVADSSESTSAIEPESGLGIRGEAVATAVESTETVALVSQAERTTDIPLADFNLGPDAGVLDGNSGGTIEMRPMATHDLIPYHGSAKDEAWEIHPDSIRRVQEITHDAETIPSKQMRQVVDKAIAMWFDQSTGFIDDIEFRRDLPSTLQDVVPSMVDVVLDATIGMHRSVGMIAETPTEDSSSQVRDAVLAAIAAENPHSVGEHNGESAQARVGRLAYPATAIVAGTILATVRRRKSVKLEASH